MNVKKLAKQLNVSEEVIRKQAIKCDKCSRIANYSISQEFGGVEFYCTKHKPKYTGGDIVNKINYKVTDHVNGTLIETV